MSIRSIRRNIIKNKTYEGKLQGNRKGFAFFLYDQGDFYIPHEDLHGAQHGDTVVVRRTNGDRAEVIKILERGIARISGIVEKSGRNFYVIPDNQYYYSDIKIKNPQRLVGREKVIIDITDYEDDRYPSGEIVKVLGRKGEESTELLSTLYSYGFSDTFPEEVIKRTERIYPLESGDRLDLRDLQTVTIDGDDAKDFDDAISVSKEKHKFILWVHIADVSSYVIKGDPIDKEAYARGTSVYFPKQAYPMLPDKLCNDVCSLREGEDKATVSVKMVFDAEGNRLSAKPYNTYIRSNRRLTYNAVQELFDGIDHPEFADVKKMLFDARELSALLSVKREQAGSIDFSDADARIIFKDGEIADVEREEQRESEKLIENFMVSCNEAVAETLENAGFPCVYRVHDEPDQASLKQFTLFASCFTEVPERRYLKANEISEFIKKCSGTPEGALISKVGIRSMKKAEYSPYNIGHYGLRSECYCHFTSPIRRYPDLIVHRLLKRYMTGKPYADLQKKSEEMVEYCKNCSERERSADRAERDALDYYKAVYMSEHIGERFEGMVSGVTASSIFVTLENGIEGRIRVDGINDGFYYDEMRYTLVGQRYAFRLGDSVKIRVFSSDVDARKVEFVLDSDEKRKK